MKQTLGVLSGLSLGLGLMYFMDPDRGTTRRALVRDKAVKLRNQSGRFLGKAARDLQHRARGVVASTASRIRPATQDEAKLTEHIRSRMGRVVSHPHAVQVSVDGGRVVLSGPVLRHEGERLITMLSRVRGVRSVNNFLDMHDQPDITALQGGHPHNGHQPWARSEWTPSMRVAAGVAGTSLVAWGLLQRSLIPLATGLLGAGLVARAVASRGVRGARPVPVPPPPQRSVAW